MRRTFTLLTLLFALVWQSAALARIGSTVNVMADLEHAALHWLEKAHHHHDDGSFHEDESHEGVQHLLSDSVTSSTALLATCAPELLPAGSASPDPWTLAHVPEPPLDGLLRPPRAHS